MPEFYTDAARKDWPLSQQAISDLMDARDNLQKELDFEKFCAKELRDKIIEAKEVGERYYKFTHPKAVGHETVGEMLAALK